MTHLEIKWLYAAAGFAIGTLTGIVLVTLHYFPLPKSSETSEPVYYDYEWHLYQQRGREWMKWQEDVGWHEARMPEGKAVEISETAARIIWPEAF